MNLADATDARSTAAKREQLEAFEGADEPAEVAEARETVEQVARAIRSEWLRILGDWADDWADASAEVRDHYHRLAAAAVAAYRAAPDGGAEEAAPAKKVARCGRGYTDAEHWIDGYYACPGFASPAVAPQTDR